MKLKMLVVGAAVAFAWASPELVASELAQSGEDVAIVCIADEGEYLVLNSDEISPLLATELAHLQCFAEPSLQSTPPRVVSGNMDTVIQLIR